VQSGEFDFAGEPYTPLQVLVASAQPVMFARTLVWSGELVERSDDRRSEGEERRHARRRLRERSRAGGGGKQRGEQSEDVARHSPGTSPSCVKGAIGPSVLLNAHEFV
jgi:hypothetical protein